MGYDVSGISDYIAMNPIPIMEAIYGGGDASRFCRIQEGVKGSMRVGALSSDIVLQENACGNPSGGTTVEEVMVNVGEWALNESYCTSEMNKKLPPALIGPGSHQEKIPWAEQTAKLKANSLGRVLERAYWQGDTAGAAPLNRFDGLIKNADAVVGQMINGNPTGITALTPANIIGAVDGMASLLPADVKEVTLPDRAVVAIGYSDFEMYVKALINAKLYVMTISDAAGLGGIKEIQIPGTNVWAQKVYGLDGTDRMFASRGSNMVITCDRESDEIVKENSELPMEVWYDKNTNAIRFRKEGKSGTAVYNPAEWVQFTLA